MAFQAYISIKGAKQGQIKGESKKGSLNDKWIEIVAYKMETQSAVNPKSGGGSGKHKPITITKEADSASPQLLQAHWANEVLTEVIFEVRLGGHTTRKFTLNDATIIKVGPPIKIPHGSHSTTHYESLQFAYDRITFENIAGSTTTADDWEATG